MALSLSGWQLTLPIDGGDSDSNADTLRPAKEKLPWFDVLDNGATFQFTNPQNGATTPNSDDQRTELTQLDGKEWSSGTLTFSQTMLEIGSEKVCICQVWSERRPGPMVMVWYDPGYTGLRVTIQNAAAKVFNWLPAVGQQFTLRVRVQSGVISVTLTQGAQSQTVTNPVTFSGKYRFKFGAYVGRCKLKNTAISMSTS